MTVKTSVFAGLLAVVMSLGLVACGQSGSSAASSSDTSSPAAQSSSSSSSVAQSSSSSELDAAEQEAFYITEITDDIFARIKGKSFKDDCTLPREDLRYLHVLHKDKDGTTHEGEMIVNKHIAEDVLSILQELYKNNYPIEKMRLIDEYNADDELSMEDNNSSSFNFRFISHTTRISKHGLGLAVDINTLYNPYTKVVDGERIVEPVTGEPYLDREASFDSLRNTRRKTCRVVSRKRRISLTKG